VSKRRETGDNIAPPDDSLSNYFEDLLGGEDLLEHAFAVIDERSTITGRVATGSGGARVVSLPTKKNGDDQSRKNLRTEPLAKPVAKPVVAFVEPEPVQTLDQKLKLEKLLQSARTPLLVDVPVTVQVTTDASTTTAFVCDPHEIQEWVIETPVADEAPVEVIVELPVIAQELQSGPGVQAAHYQIEALEWLENGRPQWAQSRFDVLLFKVSGLTLAVPLISLGQIQPLTDELTPLFGQADWFMGLQPTPAGKIRTVNTAKFVMPERYDERFLETARYVVSINGVPWGLAVDSVNQPITLMPDDVKWRSDRSKRPWLAGTVKEHMCALLDIPRIGQMLIEADKNFVPGR